VVCVCVCVCVFVLAFLYNETSFVSKEEYVTVSAQVSRTIELYWREIRFGLQLMTNYGATAPNDPCDVLLHGSMTNKQISHSVCHCYRLSQLSFFLPSPPFDLFSQRILVITQMNVELSCLCVVFL